VRGLQKLADIDEEVSTFSEILMHDVHAGSIRELRILDPFRWIELPMRTKGSIEKAGDDALNVRVVVEVGPQWRGATG
jgi:hypothetical protein